jgi:hypothetical protein
MAKKSKKHEGLLNEFWGDAKIPYGVHDAEKELFGELGKFMDPKSYVGDGIVRSMLKLMLGLTE